VYVCIECSIHDIGRYIDLIGGDELVPNDADDGQGTSVSSFPSHIKAEDLDKVDYQWYWRAPRRKPFMLSLNFR
jgi:hypothetical protein